MNLLRNFFYCLSGILFITSCSDDDVNNFSPVPYPDEMVKPTPEDPSKPQWNINSPSITVFKSKKSTDISYRVPTIATTPKGTILVFCEGRYNTWMDKNDRTDILVKRSTDKGVTWSEKNITELPSPSKLSFMDPTVVVDKVTGKIFLFTSLWDAVNKPNEKKGFNNRAIMYTSEDDGVTWSKRDLTNEVVIDEYGGFERIIGSFGPGTGVQMTANKQYKNRLIVPIRTFKIFRDNGTVSNGGNTALWSDDNGATWHTGQPNKSGEWMITEAPDGALMGNIRYNGYRQSQISTDGGAKWSSISNYSANELPTPSKGCSGSIITKDNWLYYCGPKGITSTNSHDERGILCLSRAQFTNGHTHKFKSTDQMIIYDKAAGYSAMALLPSGELLIIAEVADGLGFTTSSIRPAGWMRLELFTLTSK